jgi:amino acid transporter
LDAAIKWTKIGAIVLAVIFVAYTVIAFLFPDVREALRDIAIVILAVFMMTAAVLAIVILVAVLSAIQTTNRLIQETVIPRFEATSGKLDEVLDNTRAIVGNARDSASTVTTTTVFTAEQVVSPIIRVSGLMAGVRAAASALARRDVHLDDVPATEHEPAAPAEANRETVSTASKRT